MRIYKNLLLVATLALTFNSTLSASDEGKELFMQKCAVCHPMQKPKDKSQMLAPPAMGLMFHLKDSFGSDEEILAHIKSFTVNPEKAKAICPSVRRFGLMPSQRENITDKELDAVAHWMIKNF